MADPSLFHLGGEEPGPRMAKRKCGTLYKMYLVSLPGKVARLQGRWIPFVGCRRVWCSTGLSSAGGARVLRLYVVDGVLGVLKLVHVMSGKVVMVS